MTYSELPAWFSERLGFWPTPLPLNFIFCLFLPESPIHIQSLCDIRDYGKNLQQLEMSFDETNDKLTKDNDSVEEAEKQC